ncbi:hypothetical protein GOBAR_AA09824 [Gossypium barbadense]|uniref:Uncharacterized protein n=1 Tax=Gossypium barbadense TaxID=3634 RepID=A0A2P5Y5F0_GOSBA|nr:hypothetical protein GOBAR_AA09824 [Gossypium barbadense]
MTTKNAENRLANGDWRMSQVWGGNGLHKASSDPKGEASNKGKSKVRIGVATGILLQPQRVKSLRDSSEMKIVVNVKEEEAGIEWLFSGTRVCQQ